MTTNETADVKALAKVIGWVERNLADSERRERHWRTAMSRDIKPTVQRIIWTDVLEKLRELEAVYSKGGTATPDPADGAARIAAERRRQYESEGYTREYDQVNRGGGSADTNGLATAAAVYALPAHKREYLLNGEAPTLWPWGLRWWKPTPLDRVRELEKAGALIAAEIDRLLTIERSETS